MKVKPLLNNVLFERISVEQKTKGGIIVHQSDTKFPMQGKVLKISNSLSGCEIAEGDIIIVDERYIIEISVDLYIISANDIIAIVEH